MKKYIKPIIDITMICMDDHLMAISGTEETMQGDSNGDYTGGVTLGAREFEFIWDDEDLF